MAIHLISTLLFIIETIEIIEIIEIIEKQNIE